MIKGQNASNGPIAVDVEKYFRLFLCFQLEPRDTLLGT